MGDCPNVFISWSGPRSKAMGEALRGWLPHVIQSVDPFFSNKDIEAGAFWDEAIRTALKTVRFAVVCCTPENVTAPWLNYEAGALAENLHRPTAPWLLGSKPEALSVSPLSRLQAHEADKAGTLAILQGLNNSLVAPLSSGVLSEAFETHWPKLEAKLLAIPETQTKLPERKDRDMLEEVVGLCRQLVTESRTFPQYWPSGSYGTGVVMPNGVVVPVDLGGQGAQGVQGPQGPSDFFLASPVTIAQHAQVTWGAVRPHALNIAEELSRSQGLHLQPDELESVMLEVRRKIKVQGISTLDGLRGLVQHEMKRFLPGGAK
jgi:hypothetical protein